MTYPLTYDVEDWIDRAHEAGNLKNMIGASCPRCWFPRDCECYDDASVEPTIEEIVLIHGLGKTMSWWKDDWMEDADVEEALKVHRDLGEELV